MRNEDKVHNYLSLASDKGYDFNESELISKENLLVLEFVLKKSNLSTQKSYNSTLKHFFKHLNGKTLKEITFKDVALYKKEVLNFLKASTVKTKLTEIKSLFSYLKKIKYIDENPLSEISLPKVDEVEILTKTPAPEEIKRLIEVAERKRDKLLIEFLYFTGLRISEALSLKFGQFTKMKNKKSLILFNVKGKGDKTRFGTISEDFYLRLKSELLKSDESDSDMIYLFRREKGDTDKSISRFYVSKLLKELSLKAKLKNPIWPHGLRHAHATHALSKGASLSSIQKTLGHSDIKITGKYLAVEVDGLSSEVLEF